MISHRINNEKKEKKKEVHSFKVSVLQAGFNYPSLGKHAYNILCMFT